MYLKSRNNHENKVKKVNLKVKRLKLIITLLSIMFGLGLLVVFLLLISTTIIIVYKLRTNRRGGNYILNRIKENLVDGVKVPETIGNSEIFKRIELTNFTPTGSEYAYYSFMSTPNINTVEEFSNINGDANKLHEIKETFKNLFCSVKMEDIKYVESETNKVKDDGLIPNINGVSYPFTSTHIFSYEPNDSKNLKSPKELDTIMEKYIISLLLLKPANSKQADVIKAIYRMIAFTIMYNKGALVTL